MREHGNLGPAAGVTGAALDFQQALLDLRHFMAEQLNHEFWRRAREDDGRAAQGQVHLHDHGAHAVTAAQVFLGDHLAAAQASLHPTRLDDQVALVHAFDGASEDFFTTGHEVGQEHFALCVADLLQNDLLGRHCANAANGDGFNALFDVLTHFDVGHTIPGVHQELFGVRILQTGVVGHHEPAAEGFVIAAVAVQRHTDVHFAGIELFRRLCQCQFDGAQHHVALDVLLARNGFNQHQQFAIHATTLLFLLPLGSVAAAPIHFTLSGNHCGAGLAPRPLKFTIGASRASLSSSSAKPKACSGAGTRLALTR